MARYDIYRTFENLPRIMGMELVRRGDRWEGGYYMNGERHQYRRDKLKVAKWNNDIWVHEEGGESQSITTWLQNYGGASDYWDAVRILRGGELPVKFDGGFRPKKVERGRTVPRDAYEGEAAYDLGRCPLFCWMADLFGAERVREAWERYGVTTDAHGNAVFWSVDVSGGVLHDKRMRYKSDGHRDREYGAWRKYKTGDGYTGRSFFGAYVWRNEEKVYLLESEKSALLFYLYYNKPAMATGGKNALRDVDDRIILVPDMDARHEWDEHGNVWEWWKNFDGVEDHDDIGDAIVRRILQDKN